MRIRLSKTLLLLIFTPGMGQEDRTSARTAFFESNIRPVLADRCYECHSSESGKAKGGLRLDTREAIRKGGDSGPAIVPGDPGNSLLLTAIRQDDPDLEMPPKGAPLSKEVIRNFERWIRDGAVDPRDVPESTGPANETPSLESRKNHWSYRPLRDPAPPASGNAGLATWPLSPIDRFVLAQLEKNDLTPSPDAPPTTLLRRLCFDLTGLPPTPEQARAFSLSELEDFVDDLLASEGFGVRWGRHWLDVARFAESNGKEANIVYPHAWRYRDYVIEAFDEDLPYDRFLLEQIAGDLLPAADDRERARLLTATGFLALGAKGLAEQNDPVFAADLADEQIDATGRAVLASSIACARCHDHKADPFSMEDYYALAGIFQSTDTRFGTWIDSENNQGGRLIVLPRLPGQLIPNPSIGKAEVAKLEEKLAALNREEEDGKRRRMEAMARGKDMQQDFNAALREALRIYWSRGPIVGKLETVDDEGKALPLCMGVLDRESKADSPIYERGELTRPGPVIPRAVPAFFGVPGEGPIAPEESGRLQLAKWLTHPEHPLTARVMVNRIWSHLFGAGLVATVDNFGTTGEKPSHPELLDHLAHRFREGGWSVKTMIREIVLSRTYRQDSVWRRDCFENDPDNRLLWRMEKKRLDAEVIRDAMLAVSGELDPSPRPCSLAADLRSASVSLIGFNPSVPRDLDGTRFRSIYLPVFRDHLPDVLALFDFAEPSLVTGKRDHTNVPPQALYLMNSDFVRDRAAGMARRLRDEASTRDARIERAFQLCFNRSPDPGEREILNRFFEEASTSPSGLTQFCQALLASAEFRIAD